MQWRSEPRSSPSAPRCLLQAGSLARYDGRGRGGREHRFNSARRADRSENGCGNGRRDLPGKPSVDPVLELTDQRAPEPVQSRCRSSRSTRATSAPLHHGAEVERGGLTSTQILHKVHFLRKILNPVFTGLDYMHIVCAKVEAKMTVFGYARVTPRIRTWRPRMRSSAPPAPPRFIGRKSQARRPIGRS